MTVDQPECEPEEGDNRTTRELILVLVRDFRALQRRMLASSRRGFVSEADGSHARNLIRALFAFVEGTTFVLKVDASMTADERGQELSFPEELIVFEVRHDLDAKGEVAERSAHLPLDRNVRFAFKLCSRVYGVPSPLNTSDDWWHAFMRCEKVRHRLMHPRLPGDLDIGPPEILDAFEAFDGFLKAVLALRQREVKKRRTRRGRSRA